MISIVGEGGVGKSALAIQCCYEILDMPETSKYDAIVWVSLKTKTLTASGIQDIRESIVLTTVRSGAIEIALRVNRKGTQGRKVHGITIKGDWGAEDPTIPRSRQLKDVLGKVGQQIGQ